ncbi:MAG: hypothetical protein ACTIM4_00900 [Marinomonas sp.]
MVAPLNDKPSREKSGAVQEAPMPLNTENSVHQICRYKEAHVARFSYRFFASIGVEAVGTTLTKKKCIHHNSQTHGSCVSHFLPSPLDQTPTPSLLRLMTVITPISGDMTGLANRDQRAL